MTRTAALALVFTAFAAEVSAQKPPYNAFPKAEPPYYRVRYEPSDKPGELRYGANYTVWIPPGAKQLRGVIVHQHGCGEGSCRSGLTGAFDLHWQALAKKHDCALLSPAYEQPDKADCQMWCDPRNGSDAAFRKCLADLGAKCGHPELATVPWALWGHSGGGHWCGGMVMLHPERVAAAWLRSGVPLLQYDPNRKTIKAHKLPDAALKVPLMCNLGTKEGVTVKDKQFAGVWPANEVFFNEVRGKGGLVAVAVDPLSSHDCGNQRYLAIPWLDACLSARLPQKAGDPLKPMPTEGAWLALPLGTEAFAAAKFPGEPLKAGWLPNEAIAKAWTEYVKDTKVSDASPPPAPTNVRLKGHTLTWEAEADLESGLAHFVIERDGAFLAQVPGKATNPFGRPVFQNLQYSDTPTQPLVPMQFTDAKPEPGKAHTYRVVAVNTVGLKSKPSADAALAADKPAAEGWYLAVGHGGHRMLSRDGKAWEKHASWGEPKHDQNDLNVAVNFKGAFYAGGGFFSGRMTATRDGERWSDGVLPGSSPIFGLEVLDGVLYAIDLRGAVFKTSDGEKWELVARAEMPSKTHWIRGTAQGNGLIVGSGDFGPVTVFDPKTGKIAVHQMAGQTEKNAGFHRVAFGNGVFVVGGQSGLLATSADGKEWANNVTVPGRGDVHCVVFTGTEFLATLTKGVLKSKDGKTWEPVTGNVPRQVRRVNGWLYGYGWPHSKFSRSADGVRWEPVPNEKEWHGKAYAFGPLAGGEPPAVPRPKK